MKRLQIPRISDFGTIFSRVADVYEDLGKIPFERNCQSATECCRFRLTGKTPFLTRGEALLAARAWKATGRKLQPETSDGQCPMLAATGKCTIYAARPFACRTHFCQAAGGPLERPRLLPLIRRLEELELEIDSNHDGPMPMRKAIDWALAALPRPKP